MHACPIITTTVATFLVTSSSKWKIQQHQEINPGWHILCVFLLGGGINEDNLERILQIGAKEFHCSARIFQESNMLQQKSGITLGGSLSPPEYGHRIASLMKVNNMMNIASMCWESLNK